MGAIVRVVQGSPEWHASLMSKRPSTYWKPEQAKDALAEWRASGLSVKSFAEKAGLRRNRLNWWRKRLGDWNEPKALTGTLSAPPAPACLFSRKSMFS